MIQNIGIFNMSAVQIPEIPTGLNLSQPVGGEHIIIEWNIVPGAAGYRLKRNPAYYTDHWVEVFDIIINTLNNIYHDDIQEEGPLNSGDTIIYKVCAYNDAGDSLYSEEVHIHWTD